MARKKTRVRQGELGFMRKRRRRRKVRHDERGERSRVPHGARPQLSAREPIHVVTRLEDGLPSLRKESERRVLEEAFAAGADRLGFRLVHFSIQSNHLHLIVEATDRVALSRGMQGLLVRIARKLNKLWRRKGPVFADRYFARAMSTPREVRTVLDYVLHNARYHGAHVRAVDPFSSGPWFDGWTEPMHSVRRQNPCVAARTWLLRTGWRLHGLIEAVDRADVF